MEGKGVSMKTVWSDIKLTFKSPILIDDRERLLVTLFESIMSCRLWMEKSHCVKCHFLGSPIFKMITFEERKNYWFNLFKRTKT